MPASVVSYAESGLPSDWKGQPLLVDGEGQCLMILTSLTRIKLPIIAEPWPAGRMLAQVAEDRRRFLLSYVQKVDAEIMEQFAEHAPVQVRSCTPACCF